MIGIDPLFIDISYIAALIVIWLKKFDPRKSLAAAIGWSVIILVGTVAFVAAGLVSNIAERQIRATKQQLLVQYATQIHHELTMNMVARVSVIRSTALQLEIDNNSITRVKQVRLDSLQKQFPEFAWIGITDTAGTVMAATGSLLVGKSVSDRDWYKMGRDDVFLGEVHPAGLLMDLLPPRADGEPKRFVDIAVPLHNNDGTVVGVLGAQLHWKWIETMHQELLQSLESEHELELLLGNSDGTVLIGPGQWVGEQVSAETDFSAKSGSLVGYYREPTSAYSDTISDMRGLGWAVVVLQDLNSALAPAERTRRIIFSSVFLSGLLATLCAVMATLWLTRSLSSLASQAKCLKNGEVFKVVVPRGQNEVSDIAGTLADLVNQLQREKQQLQDSNSLLETRVQERTERIERMAEDAQRAAITRDRLRLARDLHDTLAHSLMALLTQIRLIRKFSEQFTEKELEAELDQTEQLALSGLQDARSAITEIRQSSVQDIGIGVALQTLVEKFTRNTGATATIQVEPSMANLATLRLDTVYRIAEQAIVNAERHARCSELTVILESISVTSDYEFYLSVIDNGVGYDTAAHFTGHYGLIGMREQANLIDGNLRVHSELGAGTTITVEFNN